MCERRDNEMWWSYAFRASVEHPKQILFLLGIFVAVSGFIAAGYIYRDMRNFFDAQSIVLKEQSGTLQLLAQELREMNIRIEHLEHK